MGRSIALLLLLLGIVFITIGYSKQNLKCPLPEVEYRLIPKTFYEEQLSNQQLQTNDLLSDNNPFTDNLTYNKLADDLNIPYNASNIYQ